ncbi:MAG: hypothetical protein RR710_01090 [Oscillospiraceae bacterium]
MNYNKESSAYDLSAFQTKQSSVVKPNLQVIGKSKSTSVKAISLGTMLLGLLIIGMLAATLYSNALINELGNEISTANKEYTTLISENRKLATNLECKVSLKNIETYAKENLGLSKIEPYQIEYVNMSPEDKIEYVKGEQEDKIAQKLISGVSQFIQIDKTNDNDKTDK